MKKIHQHSQGFSLVEMIISISVFMIFLALSFNAYTYLMKANKTANESQKIYREVRHVFDVIAASARNMSIDFSCIDTTNPAIPADCVVNTQTEKPSVIAFIDDHGKEGATRTFYKFEAGGIWQLVQEKTSNEVPWTPSDTWQRLTSETIQLESADFSIFPRKDPYDTESAYIDALQWQPSIGMSVGVKGKIFKTTYSSRLYGKQKLYGQ